MRMNMLIMIILSLIMSCERAFDQIMVQSIETTCDEMNDKSCIFDLKSITNFEWDEVYFINGPVRKDELMAILAVKYDCGYVEDQFTRVFFLTQKRITYSTQYYDQGSKIQLRPYSMQNFSDFHYLRESSRFYVVKKEKKLFSDDYFYDLFPVDGERQPR